MNQRIWLHRIRSVPFLDRVFWGGVLPVIPAEGNDVKPEERTEDRFATALLAGCLCALILAAAIGRPAILVYAIVSLLAAQMTRLLSIRRYGKHAGHWRRVLLMHAGHLNQELLRELEENFSKLVLSTVFGLPAALLLAAFGFAWLAWVPHPPMTVELLVFVQLVSLTVSVATMVTCGWRLQRARHELDMES